MRIFVSSTFKDLRPERESAQEALRRSELVPWGMELFVSEPSKPLDVCLEQVQLSDAVILIIGFMAGSLIPESPELTYTRAEFALAQRLGRPVFAFFKTEGGVPVNKETDADKKKALDDFKNAVTSAGITPAYFDSPDRLTTELLLAVTNWNAQGRPGARRVFTTPKEFFAPFESDAPRLFDFKQTIRGREEQLQGLSAFLADPTEIVGVLTGRGGIGKSKLLHDWVQTVGNRKVLYVMEDADWHTDAAKEIPVGDLLIVADDAHRFDFLDRLLLLVRNLGQRQNVKLVLGARPSGSGSIDASLSIRFDVSQNKRFPQLERVGNQSVRDLALEVLGADHEIQQLPPVDRSGWEQLLVLRRESIKNLVAEVIFVGQQRRRNFASSDQPAANDRHEWRVSRNGRERNCVLRTQEDSEHWPERQPDRPTTLLLLSSSFRCPFADNPCQHRTAAFKPKASDRS